MCACAIDVGLGSAPATAASVRSNQAHSAVHTPGGFAPSLSTPPQSAAPALAEDLFSFLLAEAERVEGAFEAAIGTCNRAVRACSMLPDLPTQHNRFCVERVALCYAALGDWLSAARKVCAGDTQNTHPSSFLCATEDVKTPSNAAKANAATADEHGAAGGVEKPNTFSFSSGFAESCNFAANDSADFVAKCGLHAWWNLQEHSKEQGGGSDEQGDTSAEADCVEGGMRGFAQTLWQDSAAVQPSALLDGTIMRALRSVSAVFPALPQGGAVKLLEPSVRELGDCTNIISACMQRMPARLSLAMSAEYMSLMHTAAAIAQLLIARMGTAAPAAASLPGWLQVALTSMDPCQHLLVASALLSSDADSLQSTHAYGLGNAATELLRRADPSSSDMHANNSTGGGVNLSVNSGSSVSASQFPLHALVFAVACKLASAQEYSHYGLPAANSNLPKKESALQV